jgi:hypothetical protein
MMGADQLGAAALERSKLFTAAGECSGMSAKMLKFFI